MKTEDQSLENRDSGADAPTTEQGLLDQLPYYLGWALSDNLEVVFHVFSDHRDHWTADTYEAFETFQQWVEEHDKARLYIELYEDRENDRMVHEDCLLSHGAYPM